MSAVPGEKHTISSRVAANGSLGSGWTVMVAVASCSQPWLSTAVTVTVLVVGMEVKVCWKGDPSKADPSEKLQMRLTALVAEAVCV